MRWMIAPLMAMALGSCTVARMADFGTVGESDRIDLTNVPGWANGTFRLGDARGSVQRLALPTQSAGDRT
ncbi:MAG: hypothetical protein EOP94_03000 [Zymomonas sp.]|nr:MAG: hypothetical protein EOP94_03000 [Zymomonas sp.]